MPDGTPRDGLSGLLGEVLDEKYRLDRVLGQGGMGVVYQALHLGTRRTVALKVVAPRFLEVEEFVERFRREAEAAGRLRHPNVVDVTDFGFSQRDGRRLAYLVMEYLDGCSLEDVLSQESRLPLRWVADLIDQACSAVAEAHRRGIVHRDLKPSNLWLEPDRRGGYTVKVLDFGLAKLADPAGPASTLSFHAGQVREPTPTAADSSVNTTASSGASAGPPVEDATHEMETRVKASATRTAPSASPDLTRVGATLGTPVYMSPEQCRGDPADARSDVYSLGVIAYRMVSGRTPFSGDAGSLIRQHLTAIPPPLDGAALRVPKPVSALVMSALAKDPAARPPSAAGFGAAFVARSQGPGSLLQQALTLFLEHARPFFAIAAAGLLPALAAIAVVALSLPRLVATPSGPPPPSIIAALLLTGLLVQVVLAAGLMSAVAVSQPIVAQVLAMPLRPVELRPLLHAFRRRLLDYARLMGSFVLEYLAWVLSPALLIALVAVFGPGGKQRWILLLLVVWVGSCVTWLLRVQESYSFAGGAILMEGLAGGAAIERSRSLARHAKRDLPGFVGLRGAILVMACVTAVAAVQLVGGSATALGAAALLLVIVPFILAAYALMLIAVALLYFRARQAAGEPLHEALEQFETQALPAGYWQQQVRDRIRSRIESSR